MSTMSAVRKTSLRMTLPVLVSMALLLGVKAWSQPPGPFAWEQAAREVQDLGSRRMELSNRPGCYAFVPGFGDLDQGPFGFRASLVETLTWTGECVDGLAEGMGTLTFLLDRSSDAGAEDSPPAPSLTSC